MLTSAGAPRGGAYLRADIDGFTEKGANGLDLKFEDFNADSLTSNLGLEATYSISTGIGVITPGVNGRWVREFADDDGPDVVYANDPTCLSAFQIISDGVTRNYGVLGASVAAQFAGSIGSTRSTNASPSSGHSAPIRRNGCLLSRRSVHETAIPRPSHTPDRNDTDARRHGFGGKALF
jgi:uncharacterized protein YhjY with autotransporter beta-barrel domain